MKGCCEFYAVANVHIWKRGVNLKTAVEPRCFKHRGTETRRKGDLLSYMFTYDFSIMQMRQIAPSR